MEVNLQSVEDQDLLDTERAIFNLLKASLQYPADAKLIAAKVTDDINFICRAEDRSGGDANIMWYVWSVIIEIARCVPSDHPWQDCLAQAVDGLRRQEGAVPSMEGDLWKDLPDLSVRMMELWEDPTVEVDEELIEGDFARWRNQNSFAARLTTPSFAPWLTLPLWQLRKALEEPPTKGPVQECRVWVACEWIIRCAEIILDGMDFEHPPSTALQTGSLCGDDIPQLGVERWEFWKKRFGEIAADAENLELGSAIVERISDARKRMDGIQK
ncbi:hypothetical protein F5B20DRAFT_518050 [Whalleya microplaca]|nr:hypothetical protein F5B20DRAFT_518050 [Whalleya microplaca]